MFEVLYSRYLNQYSDPGKLILKPNGTTVETEVNVRWDKVNFLL